MVAQDAQTKVHNWSIASNLPYTEEINAQDVFLFLVEGNGPKGIIGFGEILTKVKAGDYWVTGEPGRFVKLRFGEIIDPFREPHFVLSRDVLLGLGLHQFEWGKRPPDRLRHCRKNQRPVSGLRCLGPNGGTKSRRKE